VFAFAEETRKITFGDIIHWYELNVDLDSSILDINLHVSWEVTVPEGK